MNGMEQTDFQLMVEAIDHMKITRRQKDFVRAAMQCAIEYACMKRATAKKVSHPVEIPADRLRGVAQTPDYKTCFFDTLKMLHEALDTLDAIDAECILPPQLQDFVDAALVHRSSIAPQPPASAQTGRTWDAAMAERSRPRR